MKVLSFNAQGLGGAPKLLSLKRLCKVVNPDVIMVQETMCIGARAEEICNSWLRGWTFFLM
jgi:exonuclease III